MASRSFSFWRAGSDDWHSVFSDEFLVLLLLAACAASVGCGVWLLVKIELDRRPRGNILRLIGWILVLPGLLVIVALWLLFVGWLLSGAVR